MIPSGVIAGLVQAYIKRPKVRDLEDLPDAILSARGFWMNPVTRVLLVFTFCTIGIVLGEVIAGIAIFWISSHSL